MSLLATGAMGGPKATITGDQVTHLIETGLLFELDIDHVEGPLHLTAPFRHTGFQVIGPAYRPGVERSRQCLATLLSMQR